MPGTPVEGFQFNGSWNEVPMVGAHV